ncbi:TRAP-type C4-dicarboxylate transport system permease small subunit [Halanaerobium saccharolyticum]|uniref:TRAP-type C4-dicarboxylate transport system permease small subunit n=1 Tax=Halanaerobium saccharolyticum TaxID=43595 RepID=A0A4R7Z1E5_9FIRM|nr:TRAP transporter small permease [Halanaerobium saccharolyticum]RAK08998.1 TRAP-type C4-dicarboxylate transport system permease small subunit [Halanaerobium saccharolyticum]TDW02608.1 TRAP-type C4-dicarboxylate transport system permease small subunit [Halanaerobium saccharolyticum]TDX60761.1 TRAP-type C4-dicarboxylate transport system permease small subunit [Halanaerobium saccharolyticum]
MKKEKNEGKIKSVLNLSEQLISYLAMIFLVVMIIIVSTTVFTRYTINFTFRWTDEVALLMMIWFGFLGMALGVKQSVHLSIEFFMSLFPEKYQGYIYKIENILVGVFGWYLVKYGWQLFSRSITTVLPATQWSRGLLFIALPISGAFILIYSIFQFFGILENKSSIVDQSALEEDNEILEEGN